jgi:short-subunit dehydrogenase
MPLAAAYTASKMAVEGFTGSLAHELRAFDVRVKLGNYFLMSSRESAAAVSEAERLAKEVLQKDANHIEGHILMASVLFAQEKKPEAFAEVNRAIELDPKRVESYLSLARFHALSKDNSTADAVYQRAIGVNNASAMAHYESQVPGPEQPC